MADVNCPYCGDSHETGQDVLDCQYENTKLTLEL